MNQPPLPVFRREILVPAEALDSNGHVNNVVYLRWIQDSAVEHARATGGAHAARAVSGLWVVRRHEIDYLHPAFEGDRLLSLTWVVRFRKARSFRRHQLIRLPDHVLIARGESQYAFVDAHTGRPRPVPETVADCFTPLGTGEDPSANAFAPHLLE